MRHSRSVLTDVLGWLTAFVTVIAFTFFGTATAAKVAAPVARAVSVSDKFEKRASAVNACINETSFDGSSFHLGVCSVCLHLQ